MTVWLRVALVTLLLTGGLYPLAVWGLAQLLFPTQASGSLVPGDHGTPLGSELIGQTFQQPYYLHPRPSAAGNGYDAAASSGSNLGPTSEKLRERVATDCQRLERENPEASGPVPVELVATSASGLDPHLSPEAALWQVPRIARARGNLSPERIQRLILDHVEPRTWGFLGEPRVNVLAVNLALDRRFGPPAPQATGD
jgi:K+-transporting ATPase ATPase C chain